MRIKHIIKKFKKGSVCVTGLRGCGKDVLFGNVIARRKQPYVSNLDYGGDFSALNLSLLDCGGNTYRDFVNDTLKPYNHPYKKGADIYISDVGVYLPSQYCNNLNKDFQFLPTYVALSRQISRNNVHFNVQNLNRAWDKFREQSDTYIRCRWCKVIFGIVFMGVTIYDKPESCQNRVSPCRVKKGLLTHGERKTQIDIYQDNFFNSHGSVKNRLLIFKNKSKHDTYDFEKKLKVVYSDEKKENN